MLSRTLVPSAIFLACFYTSPLFAQRGAGHSASGSAHFSGARAPASAGFTGISPNAFSQATTTGARAPGFTGYTGIAQGALRSPGRNYPGRGYLPFFGYPYYLSTFDDYSYPYNNSYVQNPGAETDQVTANLMGEQVNRLTAEVEQLRAESSSARGGPYAPYAAPAASDPPAANDPPIILVMQSGTKVTMRSYAVMGQTFWDFSTQPMRKIPFSTVDLAASAKATAETGAEFPALP